MEWDDLIKIGLRFVKFAVFIGVLLWGRYTINKRNKSLQRYHEAFDKEDYEGSLWHLNKYLETHPKDDVAYYYKGVTLMQIGEEASEEAFLQAVAINSKNELAHFELGKYYFNHDACDLAINHLKQAKKRMKKHAEVYFYLGLSYFSERNTEEGLRSLNKAISYEKEDKDYIIYALYCFYKESKDEEQAQKYKSKIKDQSYYFHEE